MGPAPQRGSMRRRASAVDAAGNVYVADQQNCFIRKVTPAGVVTRFAGTIVNNNPCGSTNGAGDVAQFNGPNGVATDSAGNVYVADTFNNKIRKITPAGVVSTLAGTGAFGFADGPGTTAQFRSPRAVAVDAAGNVYVADTQNHNIRQVTPGGVVTTVAGAVPSPTPTSGSADGTGSAARFNNPYGIAVDSAGNVYVGDSNNNSIRKIAAGAVVTTLAGGFNGPRGVAVDGAGTVYVAETFATRIRQVTAAGVVTTLAGAFPPGGSDGPAASAHFNNPEGVAVDAAGVVYVADTTSDTIRKISSGVVTTLAGFVGSVGSADGEEQAARFSLPSGVALDSNRTLYVADRNNNTIRKITPAGVVTTFAGLAGASGNTDGTGSAARFGSPAGVAVDNAGTVYVFDTGFGTIRKITPDGVVTTLAGDGTYGNTDGTGSAARFSSQGGIAVDRTTGVVYVADGLNNAIRKIAPGGIVTTIAGGGASGFADGTGSVARFTFPRAVAVDAAGVVYIADNTTIRRMTHCRSGDDDRRFGGFVRGQRWHRHERAVQQSSGDCGGQRGNNDLCRRHEQSRYPEHHGGQRGDENLGLPGVLRGGELGSLQPTGGHRGGFARLPLCGGQPEQLDPNVRPARHQFAGGLRARRRDLAPSGF